MNSIGGANAPAQPRCLNPNAVKHRTLRVSATGTAYAMGDDGVLRWIPDGWTYGCMIDYKGFTLVDGLTQEHLNSIGGANTPHAASLPQSECGEAWDVAGIGDWSDAMGDDGVLRWIPDGWTYGCMINWRGFGSSMG